MQCKLAGFTSTCVDFVLYFDFKILIKDPYSYNINVYDSHQVPSSSSAVITGRILDPTREVGLVNSSNLIPRCTAVILLFNYMLCPMKNIDATCSCCFQVLCGKPSSFIHPQVIFIESIIDLTVRFDIQA